MRAAPAESLVKSAQNRVLPCGSSSESAEKSSSTAGTPSSKMASADFALSVRAMTPSPCQSRIFGTVCSKSPGVSIKRHGPCRRE